MINNTLFLLLWFQCSIHYIYVLETKTHFTINTKKKKKEFVIRT